MFSLGVWIIILIKAAAVTRDVAQSPIQSSTSKSQSTFEPRRRVAIIGSGIAGASVAYSLHNDYGLTVPFEISIYEMNSQVGGRTNSTFIDNKANGFRGSVETGAQTLLADDICVQVAIDGVGLKRKVVENVRPGMKPTSVGVWNGRDLVLRREHDLKSRTWKEFARDTWKYKTAPRDLQKLVQEKLPKYRQLYGEFEDVNPSLRDMIQQLGLNTESEQPAEDYLLGKGISPSYLHDIIQPTVRALYNRDLNDLNGLSALLAMNPAISYRLARRSKGLNELSYRLLRLSEAHIQLNSRVTKIGKSSIGKYTISDAEGKNWDDYDAVVIATHEESGIEFDFPMPEFNSRPPSFVERHITTFTSTIDTTLSPQQFNVTSAAEIPDMIFTTQGSGSGIFSIEHSVVNAGLDGDVMVLENLYKIASAKSIPDSRIAEFIGQSPDVPINTLGVAWVDRQVWPLASPSITRGPRLDNVELTSGLYYTNFGEELVSSMETSCRMGRLMARLIYRRAMRDLSEGSENVP
ncbi:hypothetical protein BDZ45DRAFT_681518 [Acephala macrosclerotiorum]|nr:hypothetical protein BDZ45DRAFT_681518 [Acephala macrosclerotiorum]